VRRQIRANPSWCAEVEGNDSLTTDRHGGEAMFWWIRFITAARLYLTGNLAAGWAFFGLPEQTCEQTNGKTAGTGTVRSGVAGHYFQARVPVLHYKQNAT
jgi:hypothetical protein